MKCIPSHLADVLLFEPQVHHDSRGFFKEMFRQSSFEQSLQALGLQPPKLVQENLSRSMRHVLRGLHFQQQFPQGKLVSVSYGSIFDVAVDIRPGSKTFGQWVGHEVSAENHLQVWVPPGFAHGFYVLSDYADVHYKCSEYYVPGDQHGIAWNDPSIAVQWPIKPECQPILSPQDRLWLPMSHV